MLKLAIIDYDRHLMAQVAAQIRNSGNMELIASATDGANGLKMLRTHEVDVVLLDLVLPNKDGLYVLEEMASKPGKKPIFIVFSRINSDDVISQAMEKGAAYFIAKPFALDLLVRRIQDIYERKPLRKWSPKTDVEYSEPLVPEPLVPEPIKVIEKRPPKEFVRGVLNRIGIPLHLNGSSYVETAFLLIIEDGHYVSGDLINYIYPTVARIHGTSSSQVERCMRYLLDRTTKKGREKTLSDCLGTTVTQSSKRLTISEFLSALVYCFQRENNMYAD